MITRRELIEISCWDKRMLHAAINGRSITDALRMRCNLQRALSEYSKRNSYDVVQASILRILAWIESWARQAYMTHRLPEILCQDFRYLKKGKASAKAKASGEFDAILKIEAY